MSKLGELKTYKLHGASAEFYRGKCLVLHGATGGLGKALAQQLITALSSPKEVSKEALKKEPKKEPRTTPQSSAAVGQGHLILMGRNAIRLKQLEEELVPLNLTRTPAKPIRISSIVLEEGEEVATAAKLRQVPIDGLICATGKTVYKEFIQGTWEEYSELLHVNLSSVLELGLELIPHLAERRGFFHIAGSHSAILPVPYQALYAASKAALHHFVVSSGFELENRYKQKGLFSISIIGGMATPMYHSSGLQSHFSPKLEALFIAHPADIASCILKGIAKRRKVITIRHSGWWIYHALRRLPLSWLSFFIGNGYRPR